MDTILCYKPYLMQEKKTNRIKIFTNYHNVIKIPV